MADRTTKAQALLDIALDTYAEEILPDLPSEQRYTGAMVANALGIAQRRMASPDPGETLVNELGGDTLEGLALAIRKGTVSDTSHKNLAETLLAHVEQELEISNPRFLKRRRDR